MKVVQNREPMLPIFLLICTSFSKEKKFYKHEFRGDWHDSSVIDEALAFFNYTFPVFLPAAQEALQNADNGKLNYQDVVDILRPLVGSSAVGLLELSLAFRYFNPQAAIRKPIQSQNPILRGWSATFPEERQEINPHDFQWKFLSSAFNNAKPIDILRKLAAVNDPSNTFQAISQVPINSAIKTDFLQSNIKKSHHTSLINGRCVSNDAIEILEAILNEYQSLLIFNSIGISLTEKDLLNKILTGKPENKVYEYIPPLPKVPSLEHHELHIFRNKWSSTLNPDESDALTFLKNKKVLVNIQIFANLHSEETPGLLNYILEDCLKDSPYGYEVALIVDMENLTERRIAFSFLSSLMNIGTRASIEFLLDGFLHGFEKAYKKTRPVIPWKDLFSESANNTIFRHVNDQHNYAKKYNITEFAIIVNGQIIRDVPAFTQMKYHILQQGKRLMESTKRGFFNESTDLQLFLKQNGINTLTVKPILHIGLYNRISIDGFNIQPIMNLLQYLTMDLQSDVYYSKNPNKTSPIPVYYFNSKPPATKQLRKIESLAFTVFQKNGEIPQHVTQVIKNAKTVVGPLVFNTALTAKQLKYALNYVKLSFMENIHDLPLTLTQTTYTLLWRSTLGLKGVDRMKKPEVHSNAFVHLSAESPIEWYSILDPFSNEYRMTIEMINVVARYHIASITHLPAVPTTGLQLANDCFNSKFFAVLFANSINTDGIPSKLDFPSNWAVVSEKTESERIYHVQHVVSYGFAYGADVIKIGDQYRSPLKSNGYFLSLLPIGTYELTGTVEHEYLVSSLLPRPQFFTVLKTNVFQEIPKDNSLNIFTYSTSFDYENITRIMLYTLKNHTQRQIRFWCLSSFRDGIPKGVDTVVLSRFWPHFLSKPKDIHYFDLSSKFVFPDLIFGPTVDHVLVVNSDIVFRKDVSAFEKLDMSNSAVAMPIISSNDRNRNLYWNQRDFIASRLKRPFHNSAIAWFNMNLWRESQGGDFYRDLYEKVTYPNSHVFEIDNELINMEQLNIQVLSLQKEIIYTASYSMKEMVNQTFAILNNDRNGVSSREYRQLQDDAYEEFV